MKFRKFINLIAYLGIIVLMIGLALSSFNNKFGDWCQIIVKIAMWIEVAVGVVYAFYYARSQEQTAYMLVFGVAMIVIVTIIIIRVFM